MARAPSFHNEQHERSAEIRLDERIDNKRVPCQRPDTRDHQHCLPGELDADADYQGRANRIALIRVTQVVHRKPSVPNEHESDHDAVVTADMTRNLHTMEHSTEPLTDQSAGQPPSGEKDRPLPTVSGLVEP